MTTPSPIKVLLVDDLEDNLTALEALLRDESLVLQKARSGRAALELLLVEDFALALLDVQMPEMDGFELAELMRGMERTRHLPIIFVTAGAHDMSRAFRGYEVGAVDFLFKPIDPILLRHKVNTLVELQRRAIERERLVAELQNTVQRVEHARRRAMLDARVGHALVVGESLRDQLRDCCEALVGFGASAVRVWIYDSDREMLELRASAGPLAGPTESRTAFALGEGNVGRVAETRQPRVVPPGPDVEPFPSDGGGREELIVHPLVMGDRLVGVLTAHAVEPSEDLAPALAAVADPIALAIDRDAGERFRELFLGMLGHDLRNPLNSVIMGTQLLATNASEADRATLNRIEKSTRRMARMVTQLLDFTRARAGGGIPITPAPTDLRVIACQVVEELRAANASRSIELAATGDARGEWDADRMAQVFSNLVGNALAFGRKESTVSVKIDASGEAIRFSVHNLGPAIPVDLLPSIFNPFRRARQSKQKDAQGLGLGLFISEQIVSAHGGTIVATSNEEKGTSFDVTLPRYVPRRTPQPT